MPFSAATRRRLADAAERHLPQLTRHARPDIPYQKMFPRAAPPSVDRYGRELRTQLTALHGAAVADGLLAWFLIRAYTLRVLTLTLAAAALVTGAAGVITSVERRTSGPVETLTIGLTPASATAFFIAIVTAAAAAAAWHRYTSRLPHPWKLRGRHWLSNDDARTYRARHLSDVPADIATRTELDAVLTRRHASAVERETALVLADDGYPGTLGELLNASAALSR